MKLLIDQNLSPKLAVRLADLFPGSAHDQSFAHDCADDEQVWEYARIHGFAIVTKDADYDSLGVIKGHPPKIVWLLLGNCTTAEVEGAFRARANELETFDQDASTGTFLLG